MKHVWLLLAVLFYLHTLSATAQSQVPAYTFGDSTYIELRCANCSGYATFNLRYQTTIPAKMEKVPMHRDEASVFRATVKVHQPQFGLFRMNTGLTFPFYALPGDSLIVTLDINNFDVIQNISYDGLSSAICQYYFARQQELKYPETSAKLYDLKYVSYKDSLLTLEQHFLEQYAQEHPELPAWFVRTERAENPYYRIWDFKTPPFQRPDALFAKQYFNYLGIAFRNQIATEIIQLADDETRAKAILKSYLRQADTHLEGEVRDVFKTLTLTTWLPKVHNLNFADSILRAHRYSFERSKYQRYLERFRDEVILKNMMLPEFRLTRLDSGQMNLKELHGKIAYLNFWFVGCRPCEVALPYKKQLAAQLNPDEVQLVNVCLYGSPEKWRREVAEKEIPGLHLFVSAEQERDVLREFAVTGFPHYVLVAPDGLIYIEDAPGPGDIMEKIRDLQRQLAAKGSILPAETNNNRN